MSCLEQKYLPWRQNPCITLCISAEMPWMPGNYIFLVQLRGRAGGRRPEAESRLPPPRGRAAGHSAVRSSPAAQRRRARPLTHTPRFLPRPLGLSLGPVFATEGEMQKESGKGAGILRRRLRGAQRAQRGGGGCGVCARKRKKARGGQSWCGRKRPGLGS